MKFYTMDWWMSLQRLEFVDPTPAYMAYLDSIRDRLPPDLLQLQESISIHDAHLRFADYCRDTGMLGIALDGDDGHGGLRQFHLRYSDVTVFRTTNNPDNGFAGPHGYGDLGYDEADITIDGLIEHRMLFSSGIELQIICGGVNVSWRDAG